MYDPTRVSLTNFFVDLTPPNVCFNIYSNEENEDMYESYYLECKYNNTNQLWYINEWIYPDTYDCSSNGYINNVITDTKYFNCEASGAVADPLCYDTELSKKTS